MNAVLRTRSSSSDKEPKLWQVRHDDGTTASDVDSATLKLWAAEGRLTASAQISADGKTWMGAADLPELEMDWLAMLATDSVAGPFALMALETLRTTGRIPETAAVFRRQTDRDSGAQGAQLVRRAREAERQQREADAMLRKAQADIAARDLEFESERQQFAAEISRLKADLVRRDAELAGKSKTAEEAQARLAGQGELEARLVDAERELEKQDRQVAELTQKLKLAEDQLEASRGEVKTAQESLRRQLSDTVRQAQAIRARYEERSKKFTALADSLRELVSVENLPELPEEIDAGASIEEVPSEGSLNDNEPTTKARAKDPQQKRKVMEKVEVISPSEVIPPKSNITTFKPKGAAGVKSAQLAASLEAQAQQEIARATKSGGAPFWQRRK